jgi:pectinesterase
MKAKLSIIALFILASGHVLSQGVVYPKDITVAQDGSGNYKTIQEAVNSVRDFGQRVIIHIKKGTYHEKLVIGTFKTQITLSPRAG